MQLVPPAVIYQETFLRGLREFRAEGLQWWLGPDTDTAERDFPEFVAQKLADATRKTASLAPKTHLWAIERDEFVGRISIHHELTDALRVEGGHIGYDTVPSWRGRGVATQMLRLALPFAAALGFTEVLLTCDNTNEGSIRVIERNGGVLRQTIYLAAKETHKRHYWIDVS